jgi:uncharacterized protein (UPF0332 family)
MTTPGNFSQVFLVKARESLDAAESEFANGRFNTCANRCYYACFQAAVAALARFGISPSGGQRAEWGHAFVQSQFVTQLIDRRKLYPSSLRDILSRTITLRRVADYTIDSVSRTQAERALRRAQTFVQVVQAGGRST